MQVNHRGTRGLKTACLHNFEQGTYFLGDHMCLVDIHLAPFALRLSRLPQQFRGWTPPSPQTRWQKWLDALESNPHVRSTMSAPAFYTRSMDDLRKSFQGGAPP